jgi:DNA-binding MarR family transcriptional regulator
VVQELSNLYFELFQRRRDRLESLMSEFRLTASQARTLALLNPDQAMTMREAARLAYLEPSNLTGVIDKLEARGLVKRSLATEDRRVKMVRVTRAGATMREQLYARIREPAPWMLALSQQDQRELLSILRKGIAFAQTATAPAKD